LKLCKKHNWVVTDNWVVTETITDTASRPPELKAKIMTCGDCLSWREKYYAGWSKIFRAKAVETPMVNCSHVKDQR
jgi:hypothetical protein